MYAFDLLNERGRCGMRAWYRKLRLLGHDKYTARLICIGTTHGVLMSPYWVDK